MNEIISTATCLIIFYQSFIQSVSYAVRELLLDSDKKLEIPVGVRNYVIPKLLKCIMHIVKKLISSLLKNEPPRIGHNCSRNRRVKMLEEHVSTLRDAAYFSYDLAGGIKEDLANLKSNLKTRI